MTAALAAMTGTDADGAPVAIAVIRLRDTGDEQIADAERRVNELAAGHDGPLTTGYRPLVRPVTGRLHLR